MDSKKRLMKSLTTERSGMLAALPYKAICKEIAIDVLVTISYLLYQTFPCSSAGGFLTRSFTISLTSLMNRSATPGLVNMWVTAICMLRKLRSIHIQPIKSLFITQVDFEGHSNSNLFWSVHLRDDRRGMCRNQLPPQRSQAFHTQTLRSIP